ncbi:hypothetical protein QWY28_17440 [Nocardioides sp. SOB77]|uniref:LamG domain-containing protein n=1 Tax=Nocardioides oceani TaxID=3058369 RepID=A0ABT8FJG4_9ACTN|nr:hypothetical protein [Nocardioides oceani]MDN4174749.1 hypothetical protein [Nocardioides oceani]
MGAFDDWRGKRNRVFFPPRDVPNVLAWFEGDKIAGAGGANVVKWSATAGGFPLLLLANTPAAPTLLTGVANGRRAVRFGAGARLASTSGFGVAGPLTPSTGPVGAPLTHAFVFRVSSDFAITSPTAIFFQFGNQRVRFAGAGKTLYLTGSAGENVNGPELTDGSWHVGVVTFNGPNGAACYIDGYLTSLVAAPGAVIAATAYECGIVGGDVTAGHVDLGEMITAQMAPAPNLISDLTAALAEKWGLS